MKLVLAGILSVFTVNAFAQTISAPLETEAPVVKQSRGIRVSLIKPILEQRVSASYPGVEGGKVKENPEEAAFGVGLGWADLAVRDMGWMINLAYLDLGDGDLQEVIDGIVRLDGNLAYGINEKLNVRGGINLTKYTQGDGANELRPGTGAQAGIGYQLTKNLGVDAGYTFMTFGGNNKGGRTTVTTSGAEVAVTGTF